MFEPRPRQGRSTTRANCVSSRLRDQRERERLLDRKTVGVANLAGSRRCDSGMRIVGKSECEGPLAGSRSYDKGAAKSCHCTHSHAPWVLHPRRYSQPVQARV